MVFTFKVPYENGTIEAVSYDERDREIGRNRLSTAGEDTVLQAVPEAETVRAGHLAFIRLQYTDRQGVTKPTLRGIIETTVEGGKLEGLASACPFYALSYLGTKTDTYYGEALAIVRAGGSGPVTLRASSPLRSCQVTIPLGG